MDPTRIFLLPSEQKRLETVESELDTSRKVLSAKCAQAMRNERSEIMKRLRNRQLFFAAYIGVGLCGAGIGATMSRSTNPTREQAITDISKVITAEEAESNPEAKPRAEKPIVIIPNSPDSETNISSLKSMNDTQFNQLVLDQLQTLGERIPFFQQGLEAAQRQKYQFKIYRPEGNQPIDIHAKHVAFMATTDQDSKIVYFNLRAIEQKASGSVNRDPQLLLTRVIANELVHIIIGENQKPKSSENKFDLVVESILKFTLEGGSIDPKNIEPGELILQNAIIEDITSSLASEAIYRDSSGNVKFIEEFPPNACQKLFKDALAARLDAFAAVFDEGQISVEARRTAGLGLVKIGQRLVERQEAIIREAVQRFKELRSNPKQKIPQ